ncbi:monocarboxylate transporter 1 isoform X2 [Daktulosphaira vitifoliae]|uniref:monocarboxylate transporter 1 isoform X2 n=1 Tax=Daktulosphaira vitifoliae TaxID=58002 RepID=UPI0021AA8FF9|nr:monocarboxylate transporter 1 isoform X2 [Daktulosphaira vitifoliae]
MSGNMNKQKRSRKISWTESECSAAERAEETARQNASSPPLAMGPVQTTDDDGISFCEYHDLPPPPDGGYGWVIVLASFMCNMVVDGIAYTFGIFHKHFMNYYNESYGKTAWVGSLLSGMYLSAGPVVSALTNKYGCRTVCIAGSVIAAAAFALSTISPNLNVLMLTYGILGGIGFGLIYLPAVVCVGYYFETKRSLATGIAVCGSGFGTFAFAPLANLLLEHFDWRQSNLILAGMIFSCGIFGALMKPLEYPNEGCKPLLQRMADEKRMQMERGSIGGSYFIVQLKDGSLEKRQKLPLNIDPGVHSSFNLDELVGSTGSPITPIPTMAVLPTIKEVKAPEQSGSSNSSSNAGSGELKSDKKKDEKSKDTVELKNGDKPINGEKLLNGENNGELNEVKAALPRNASQPAFTTHVQGLPKNGSVPFFDRIRKTSASERYRPTLGPIKVSRPNLNSNGDIRKSIHLKLSNVSILGSKNNNAEDMWSNVDTDSIGYTSSKTSIGGNKREIVRPMSRKDIFYSGSVLNLPEYRSQKSLASYRQSILSLPKSMMKVNEKGEEEIDEGCCPCLPESINSVLSSMMDTSLLQNPVFILIGISNFFGMAGLYVPFVFLVDYAQEAGMGINKDQATFLISIIGITNTIGRVVCGFIADYPRVDSLFLNNICLLICTAAVAATPFCVVYYHYVTMAMFFGIAVSGYISLTSILLVDLLGLEKLTNAFGLLILFRGAAAIVGTPLAGAVYDWKKSYDWPFFMAAIFFLVSALTSFMAAPLKRYMDQRQMAVPQEEDDALTPIDEDDEEDDEDFEANNHLQVPTIIETAPTPNKPPLQEIKEIESVV